MAIAYNKIKIEAEKLITEEPSRRIFLLALAAVLSCSPDSYNNPTYNKSLKDLTTEFGDISHLRTELEAQILNDLYKYRDEQAEVEAMIDLQRLIVLTGLAGSGKTTIVKKIQYDFLARNRDCFYCDMCLVPQSITNLEGISFQEKFEKHLFTALFDNYVISKDILLDWYGYALMHDDLFIEIRHKIHAYIKKTPKVLQDWKEAYSNEEVSDAFKRTVGIPKITTLIAFIKESFPGFVICFDNLDRLPIEAQKQMLLFGDFEAKSNTIAIILTIRDNNLRLLKAESKKKNGHHDNLGELTLISCINRLENGENKSVQCKSMTDASIKSLLQARIDFIKNNSSWKIFNDFLNEFLEKASSNEPGIPLNEVEFFKQFWSIYDLLTGTFVDEDVYRQCNHSIREMLKLYFDFISTTMLSKNEYLSFNKIFCVEEERIRRTLLRNLFYRFIMNNGQPVPVDGSTLPNIFTSNHNHLENLDLKILLYTNNFYRRRNNRLIFKIISKDFRAFGVEKENLRSRIKFLCEPFGYSDMGYLYLDGKNDNELSDSTPIDIQPAGKYFLSKITCSREYLFWTALFCNLPFDIASEKYRILEQDTYDDFFKLKVVFQFLDEYLYDKTKKELEFYKENLTPPTGYRSFAEYYLSNFGFEGSMYIKKMITSVINTITWAYFDNHEQMKMMTQMYEDISKKFEKLILDYDLSY